ncbi:hypothetical protein [Nitrospira sp. Ecomares 2.1]
MRFPSTLVPPCMQVSESGSGHPCLYLKGISTGEIGALDALVGPEATGLSVSTVARLQQIWREKYDSWHHRPLNVDRWVSIRVDGHSSGLQAET